MRSRKVALARVGRDADDDPVGKDARAAGDGAAVAAASRMTGADSPVIADSSTEAMPSMTSPSPGISSPAATRRRRPCAGWRGVDLRCRCRPCGGACDQLLARGAQGAGLRLAAALGHRLGEIGEDDREQQPERDLQHVAERLLGGEELLEREADRSG
jgi:hypothetical protein